MVLLLSLQKIYRAKGLSRALMKAMAASTPFTATIGSSCKGKVGSENTITTHVLSEVNGTGPNISSCMMGLSGWTLVMTVGGKNSSLSSACATPPSTTLAAGAAGPDEDDDGVKESDDSRRVLRRLKWLAFTMRP